MGRPREAKGQLGDAQHCPREELSWAGSLDPQKVTHPGSTQGAPQQMLKGYKGTWAVTNPPHSHKCPYSRGHKASQFLPSHNYNNPHFLRG